MIFTDHGDATRTPDPPAYRTACSASTPSRSARTAATTSRSTCPRAPYPLGGDAAAVVEDVARLGGFGVAAHPTSSSRAGVEDWKPGHRRHRVAEPDSEWRDEPRDPLRERSSTTSVGRARRSRPFSTARSSLARWDERTAAPVVGLAGTTPTAAIGARAGDRASIPPSPLVTTKRAFRTFAVTSSRRRPLTR